MDRSILPIPDKPYAGPVFEDAKDPRAVFEPITPVRPPEGAPNVLVILLDDVGFGAASVFGGPCRTPTAERLAGNGLSFSRFHTTALCAPTRQALLTGRNHHAVGMGAITEIATSAPGYTSVRPQSAAPLAEVLRLNGFATAQFGKCHEVPVWQTSPVGPFDAWPTGGGGFEHFFGFLGGETNQYAPALYSGTTPIEQDATADEGYHFTEDMTDRAIAWVRQHSALTPDSPSSCTTHRARRTLLTTCRWSGRTSTAASSTTDGTRCGSGSSPSRSVAGSFPKRLSSRPAMTRSRRGTTCRPS